MAGQHQKEIKTNTIQRTPLVKQIESQIRDKNDQLSTLGMVRRQIQRQKIDRGSPSSISKTQSIIQNSVQPSAHKLIQSSQINEDTSLRHLSITPRKRFSLKLNENSSKDLRAQSTVIAQSSKGASNFGPIQQQDGSSRLVIAANRRPITAARMPPLALTQIQNFEQNLQSIEGDSDKLSESQPQNSNEQSPVHSKNLKKTFYPRQLVQKRFKSIGSERSPFDKPNLRTKNKRVQGFENLIADDSEFVLASSDSFSDNDFYSSLKKSHKKQVPQIILHKIAKYLELKKHEADEAQDVGVRQQRPRKKRGISIRNEQNRNIYTFNVNINCRDENQSKSSRPDKMNLKKIVDQESGQSPQKSRQQRKFQEDQRAQAASKVEESKKKSIEQTLKRVQRKKSSKMKAIDNKQPEVRRVKKSNIIPIEERKQSKDISRQKSTKSIKAQEQQEISKEIPNSLNDSLLDIDEVAQWYVAELFQKMTRQALAIQVEAAQNQQSSLTKHSQLLDQPEADPLKPRSQEHSIHDCYHGAELQVPTNDPSVQSDNTMPHTGQFKQKEKESGTNGSSRSTLTKKPKIDVTKSVQKKSQDQSGQKEEKQNEILQLRELRKQINIENSPDKIDIVEQNFTPLMQVSQQLQFTVKKEVQVEKTVTPPIQASEQVESIKLKEIRVQNTENQMGMDMMSVDSPETILGSVKTKLKGESLQNLLQQRANPDKKMQKEISFEKKLTMPVQNSSKNMLSVKKTQDEQDGDSFYGSENEQSQSSWCAKSKYDKQTPVKVNEIMSLISKVSAGNLDQEEVRQRLTEVINRQSERSSGKTSKYHNSSKKRERRFTKQIDPNLIKDLEVNDEEANTGLRKMSTQINEKPEVIPDENEERSSSSSRSPKSNEQLEPKKKLTMKVSVSRLQTIDQEDVQNSVPLNNSAPNKMNNTSPDKFAIGQIQEQQQEVSSQSSIPKYHELKQLNSTEEKYKRVISNPQERLQLVRNMTLTDQDDQETAKLKKQHTAKQSDPLVSLSTISPEKNSFKRRTHHTLGQISESQMESMTILDSCISIDGRVQTITEEVVDREAESPLEQSSTGLLFKTLLKDKKDEKIEKKSFKKFKAQGSYFMKANFKKKADVQPAKRMMKLQRSIMNEKKRDQKHSQAPEVQTLFIDEEIDMLHQERFEFHYNLDEDYIENFEQQELEQSFKKAMHSPKSQYLPNPNQIKKQTTSVVVNKKLNLQRTTTGKTSLMGVAQSKRKSYAQKGSNSRSQRSCVLPKQVMSLDIDDQVRQKKIHNWSSHLLTRNMILNIKEKENNFKRYEMYVETERLFLEKEDKAIQDLFDKQKKLQKHASMRSSSYRKKEQETAEEKIALTRMEEKDKKKQKFEVEVKKRYKQTEQIFSRNVREINWKKQTKLIYLVTLNEVQKGQLESDSMIESHKTSENFSSWVHKVLEKLKSYDLQILYDPNSNTFTEPDEEDNLENQLNELELSSEFSGITEDGAQEFIFNRKEIIQLEGNSGVQNRFVSFVVPQDKVKIRYCIDIQEKIFLSEQSRLWLKEKNSPLIQGLHIEKPKGIKLKSILHYIIQHGQNIFRIQPGLKKYIEGVFCVDEYQFQQKLGPRYLQTLENLKLDQLNQPQLDEAHSNYSITDSDSEYDLAEDNSDKFIENLLYEFDPVFDEQKSKYFKFINKHLKSKGSNYYIFESGVKSLISKRIHKNPSVDKYKIEQVLNKAKRHAEDASAVYQQRLMKKDKLIKRKTQTTHFNVQKTINSVSQLSDVSGSTESENSQIGLIYVRQDAIKNERQLDTETFMTAEELSKFFQKAGVQLKSMAYYLDGIQEETGLTRYFGMQNSVIKVQLDEKESCLMEIHSPEQLSQREIKIKKRIESFKSSKSASKSVTWGEGVDQRSDKQDNTRLNEDTDSFCSDDSFRQFDTSMKKDRAYFKDLSEQLGLDKSSKLYSNMKKEATNNYSYYKNLMLQSRKKLSLAGDPEQAVQSITNMLVYDRNDTEEESEKIEGDEQIGVYDLDAFIQEVVDQAEKAHTEEDQNSDDQSWLLGSNGSRSFGTTTDNEEYSEDSEAQKMKQPILSQSRSQDRRGTGKNAILKRNNTVEQKREDEFKRRQTGARSKHSTSILSKSPKQISISAVSNRSRSKTSYTSTMGLCNQNIDQFKKIVYKCQESEEEMPGSKQNEKLQKILSCITDRGSMHETGSNFSKSCRNFSEKREEENKPVALFKKAISNNLRLRKMSTIGAVSFNLDKQRERVSPIKTFNKSATNTEEQLEEIMEQSQSWSSTSRDQEEQFQSRGLLKRKNLVPLIPSELEKQVSNGKFDDTFQASQVKNQGKYGDDKQSEHNGILQSLRRKSVLLTVQALQDMQKKKKKPLKLRRKKEQEDNQSIQTERILEEKEKREREKQKLTLNKQKSETLIKNLYTLIRTSSDMIHIQDQIQLLPPDFDFGKPMDNEGNTLLTLAAKSGEVMVIESLIKKGSGTNYIDNEGNTALHIAIQREFIQCRDILIFYGANEQIENKEGKQPWELLIM